MDTLFRYLAMLQLIPRAPQYRATTTLQSLLEEQGFTVNLRSIQRNLEMLSNHFPLICDQSERPYRWSFDPDFKSTLPAMDTATALTLVLAEEYLKGLLPQIAVDKLSPQFHGARKFLDGLQKNGFADWARQVRAIPNGKALLPAAITPPVWQGVSDALLQRQAIDVNYHSRQKQEVKQYTLHPQGLVVRHSVSYLLATVNDYEDIRQFALHRIQQLALSKSPFRPHPTFSVENYIAEGAFGYPLDKQQVQLVARVDPSVAWTLAETPVSEQQQLSAPADDGWKTLTATVPNDQQTQWWLMGFGARVEVLEPMEWRMAIAEQAEKMMNMYAREECQLTGG
ncbi:WYL domain-containing protein [Oceanimonas baumannii]|uniref:helix-turn-helix transcriptional regulator n=1 Tax=Oceanimonas baumannii TaxID=129578 RepID=UPI001D19802F|nr:WYL domain-containing protein [Oceanimonas baumannii]MCC4263331.1 WYL domain-containing protein [Oceanimonas baumannii]